MIRRWAIFLILLSMMQGISAQEERESLRDLEWILGTWERQNARPGVVQHEQWQKISDNHFEGLGIAMKGADTVFTEKLAIVLEDGKAYYIADVPENPAPVRFTFTSWPQHGFVSENPKHDRPQKIAYRLEGDTMTAKVSWEDGGFKVVFTRLE